MTQDVRQAVVAQLEDIARLYRSRGAHRDCQVHDRFEPDCWFCQVTVLEDVLAALTAPPPHDPELREWIGAEWDRLLEDAGLEDSKREQAIEQLAQVFEAHSAAILRSEQQTRKRAEGEGGQP